LLFVISTHVGQTIGFKVNKKLTSSPFILTDLMS